LSQGNLTKTIYATSLKYAIEYLGKCNIQSHMNTYYIYRPRHTKFLFSGQKKNWNFRTFFRTSERRIRIKIVVTD